MFINEHLIDVVNGLINESDSFFFLAEMSYK